MRTKLILCISLFMLCPLSALLAQYEQEEAPLGRRPLRAMIIGAHPDDAEKAGGLAALCIENGHEVQLVSVTNGDKGHQTLGGAALARRRMQEATCSGAVIGAEYIVMNNRDGELVPGFENRMEIIRLIRAFSPDIIFTHPPDDYHPDHRYTSILVRDATYMVMVPNLAPEVPAMTSNPVVFYLSGGTDPEVVIGIDEVLEKKAGMYHCHESQMYEWLPWVGHYDEQVPEGEAERKQWLMDRLAPRWANTADRYRDALVRIYGQEKGRQFKYAEAFRASEFGGGYTEDKLTLYFPFLEE